MIKVCNVKISVYFYPCSSFVSELNSQKSGHSKKDLLQTLLRFSDFIQVSMTVKYYSLAIYTLLKIFKETPDDFL